jgi:hypothetical protein
LSLRCDILVSKFAFSNESTCGRYAEGITKTKAAAIFHEANGDRFETNDSGGRVVQKDHDAVRTAVQVESS